MKTNDSRHIDTLLTINEVAWVLFNANPENIPKKKNMNPKEITFLLENLYKNNVEYILIGGFAMAFHGFPRATGDIDLWIRNTSENMSNLRAALIKTGFPEARALKTTTQLVGGMTIFNLVESDFKVDLLHNLKFFKETDFEACYKRAIKSDYHGIEIRIIDAQDLLKEKQSLDRGKKTDLIDIDHLKGILKKSIRRKPKSN